jgi:hypothetical protein
MPKATLFAGAFVAGLACLSEMTLRCLAGPAPGPIVGNIDGIAHDGAQTYVSGWACQQGQKRSITVAVFVDHSAYETPKGTFVLNGIANLDSEPAVAQACRDPEGGKHRFVIALPDSISVDGRERKLYLHGGRVVDGVPNAAIAGSGTSVPGLPRVILKYPTLAAYPVPSGNYHSLAEHPGVFATEAELKDLAARINRPASYSTQRFAQLAAKIKSDLASAIDWDATYSGCDIDIYLRAFTSEPRGGYPSEVRSEEQLRAAMHVTHGAEAPAGVAVVAARLALYAALVKAGAAAPAGGPSPDRAAALAKRILLTWSAHGLQDQGNHFLKASQFCDGSGKAANPALHLSRGVVYSVHAQDLLMYLGALEADEAKLVNTFHSAMYDLLREASNSVMGGSHPACEQYANGQASGLESLLAIARILDDGRRFNAALSGIDPSIPVLLPWSVFFNRAIYGESDSPMECYPNSGADGLTSHPSYITATVAAGEIQDRYRNLGNLQGIGYPMGTLKGLINAAEILRVSGFDAYGYRGIRRQSIEMAIAYYSCYARAAGFYKSVTADNSRACVNASQYYGKLVNDVEKSILFGAYRFPQNSAFSDLEAAAKSAAAAVGDTDAILFGKWRD